MTKQLVDDAAFSVTRRLIPRTPEDLKACFGLVASENIDTQHSDAGFVCGSLKCENRFGRVNFDVCSFVRCSGRPGAERRQRAEALLHEQRPDESFGEEEQKAKK